MTDSQYGNYPTPSSRPPEPPYRAGMENMTTEGVYQEPLVTAGAQTESVSAGQTEPYRISATQEMPGVGSPAGQAGASAPAGAASAQGSYPNGRHSATASQYNATVRQVEPVKKSSGAGKSFVFGFLGALVACAIALGGFAAWNSNSASSSGSSATVVTGSSDSSVINAVEEGQTLAEAVAAKALPSVVAVYNYQQQQSGYGIGYGIGSSGSDELSAAGMGSGVVISEDGYILTNYHVVEGAQKLTVKAGDDERDATYVGGDSSSDVAVIKIDDLDGIVAADIGDSDDLAIGEWVMTVGAPLGLEQSVATGVVSATNRSTVMSDSDSSSYYTTSGDYMYYPNMIQTDAVINPGNSGGALVDADGKLIGINTMISSYSGDYAGVGFAIPINYARGIAEDIIAGKEPTHAILGVSISSVNANNSQRYGLSSTKGAYIASIAEGTGAADSDLQVGDIITAINGKEVSSVTDVTLDVREHQVGDTVTVTVNRGGQSHDVEVVLSSDESYNTSNDTQQQQQQQQQQNQNPYGMGNGGSSNGYNIDDLEELLKMLGM